MADTYTKHQVFTASRHELTLMLYNGALRFINDCLKAFEQGDFDRARYFNNRVQDIIREFIATLDMQYEISKDLLAVQQYMLERLVQGEAERDKRQLKEVGAMLKELRDTWVELMRQMQREQEPESMVKEQEPLPPENIRKIDVPI